MNVKFNEISKESNWLKRHRWVSITLIALSVFPLFAIVNWQSLASTSTISTLSYLFLAVLGLCVVTWRGVIGIKNGKIAERNNIKEAFTNAIQQLGAGSRKTPNIEARLGAIYTLEKLSQENKELYQPIIDILANYVRENAPIPPHFEKTPSDYTRIDVQTAMIMLGRRKVKSGEPSLNLHRVYLPEINLKRVNLENADLMGSDLRGANLAQARLQGASLFNANLENASLVCANLKGTDLISAKELTSNQLKLARNWKSAYRDQELACGAELPDFLEKYGPIADTI